MMQIENLILGAGIAGLAAGQHLKEKNQDYIIIEKAPYYGGLCSSYKVGDFIFDYFIHMSFTNDAFVRKYFDLTDYISHEPDPYNYYHGLWIKHPAINNLFPLTEAEKASILEGIKARTKYENEYTENYEKWLRYQFGDYFAEHFPLVYTRKYWAEEASNMETNWVGNRVYQPSFDEIKKGMETTDTPNTYYAKEMRYPRKGGFFEYLKSLADVSKINMNEKVLRIDPNNKIVITERDSYRYERLYTSLPLPEMISIIEDDAFISLENEISNLHWTSGYIVSIGIQGELGRSNLWNYIYDEDILTSRFYSPSLMSHGTVPDSCSSVQAEIYTKDGQKYNSNQELEKKVIEQLDSIGVIDRKNVIVSDTRFVKYCNILFTKETYHSRSIILNYLKDHGINSIGRFGCWEYYWSDQSFKSGYNAVI